MVLEEAPVTKGFGDYVDTNMINYVEYCHTICGYRKIPRDPALEESEEDEPTQDPEEPTPEESGQNDSIQAPSDPTVEESGQDVSIQAPNEPILEGSDQEVSVQAS